VTRRLEVTRRDFLKRGSSSVALGLGMGIGFGRFLPTAEAAAKTVPLKVFNEQEARLLLAMARTLFPHDFLADDSYMKVVAGIDAKASRDARTLSILREGLKRLDKSFGLMPEIEREKTLQTMEKSPFFTFVRDETINSLYGNSDVWKIFGYEGSSLEHGGYINRGFDDLDWLPKD
jgi:hypothetical protein